MSLFNEQIDVSSTAGGRPALFSWRGRTFRVRRVIGDWPARSSTPERPGTDVHLMRVSAESERGEPSIADITRDAASGRWTMRRLWD